MNTDYFDNWRKNYKRVDHAKVYNDIEQVYPEQAHFDLSMFTQAFDIVKPKKVIEAGGWKGDLAAMFISRVDSWVNVEICDNAIANTKCHHQNFLNHNPGRFDWFKDFDFSCDLFTSTHFIEHLSNEHFNLLVERIKSVPFIYIESPLKNEGEEWHGYLGTHMLTYGWDKIKELLNTHEVVIDEPYCKLFRKK